MLVVCFCLCCVAVGAEAGVVGLCGVDAESFGRGGADGGLGDVEEAAAAGAAEV